MSFVTNEERTPESLSELLAILQAQGYGQPSLGSLMGQYLALPGLVGFWPCGYGGASSSITDSLTDVSGHGLHLTLNGVAQYRIQDDVPCVTLDGTTAYFSHSDAAAFDIAGSEAHVGANYQGLTLGAWVRFDDAPGAVEAIIAKWVGGGSFSYRLTRSASGTIYFSVSGDGSAEVFVQSAVTASNQFYFVAARFTPSSSIDVWLSGTKTQNNTSIPAAIFNSSTAFGIGARPAASADYLDGRIALAFLCAAAVPDATILNLYHAGRRLFGV